jgi:hypothetical protein
MEILIRFLDVVYPGVPLTDKQVDDKENQKNAAIDFAGRAKDLRRAENVFLFLFFLLEEAEDDIWVVEVLLMEVHGEIREQKKHSSLDCS